MKRRYLAAGLTCIMVLLAYYGIFIYRQSGAASEKLKVGFIFENDESTPYTANFVLARDALMKEYQDNIEIITLSNVRATESDEPLHELMRQGCRIIFTNDYSDVFVHVASEHPETEFCMVSSASLHDLPDVKNFHSFNSQIYQGRYVTGVIAGKKLRQLLDTRQITPDQALVGFVGANPVPEVISGSTAFLLGVRSEAPEARMKLRYTGSWCDYSKEKACTETLIREGCIVISAHTNTIGPAVACEQSVNKVFLVGYNQSMMDVAPDSTLVSLRTNWTPYITAAVDAVRQGKPIEKIVDGTARGNDVMAGFDKGWVELIELSTTLAAPGTQEKVDELIRAFGRGSLEVFEGNYTGTDPDNPLDIIDLNTPYEENATSSAATFHYILDGVVEVETDEEDAA
ncbi:MAG: BMP family ABC transporter substrate-binding protein [Oscillospiraceae bacterium]|nr:BMP family ABC transporter substrate-binding protein [Oscillospiraceae bacterium]